MMSGGGALGSNPEWYRPDQTTDHLSEAVEALVPDLVDLMIRVATKYRERDELETAARAFLKRVAGVPSLAYRQITVDSAELAERRKDPEFRARLERSIEENKELLDRLEPKVTADQAAIAAAEEKGRSEERERLRETFFSRLEGAGWSQGCEVPTDAIEAAFDSACAALDSDQAGS
jgi:hypothetical protein